MAYYNGWTNRETWLVALWMGDGLEDLSRVHKLTAELIQNFVDEYVSSCNITSGFIIDMLNLSVIDYQELAEHYSNVRD
jgi:hypothetical protein